jgi:hypothetical protein
VRANPLISLAEWTGLEPATPGVTGRYSNQLNYHSASVRRSPGPVPGASACHLLPVFTAVNPGDPTGIRTPVLTVKG